MKIAFQLQDRCPVYEELLVYRIPRKLYILIRIEIIQHISFLTKKIISPLSVFLASETSSVILLWCFAV